MAVQRVTRETGSGRSGRRMMEKVDLPDKKREPVKLCGAFPFKTQCSIIRCHTITLRLYDATNSNNDNCNNAIVIVFKMDPSSITTSTSSSPIVVGEDAPTSPHTAADTIDHMDDVVVNRHLSESLREKAVVIDKTPDIAVHHHEQSHDGELHRRPIDDHDGNNSDEQVSQQRLHQEAETSPPSVVLATSSPLLTPPVVISTDGVQTTTIVVDSDKQQTHDGVVASAALPSPAGSSPAVTTSSHGYVSSQQTNPPAQPKPQASPYSLPATVSRSCKILNVETHAFCQIFADRIVVGITQLPSRHIGHWIVCHASQSPIDPKAVDYEITTVLGNTSGVGSGSGSSNLYEVYARRVTESIIQRRFLPGSDRMVVLLGISLLPLLLPPSSSPPQQQQQSVTSSNNNIDDGVERFRSIVDFLVNDLIQSTLEIVFSAKNHG